MQDKSCAYTVEDLACVVVGRVSLYTRVKKTSECRLDESAFQILYVGDISSVPESLLYKKVLSVWVANTTNFIGVIRIQLEGDVDE